MCFGIFMPSHFLILLAAAVVRLDDDEGFNGDAFAAAAVFFCLNGPFLSRDDGKIIIFLSCLRSRIRNQFFPGPLLLSYSRLSINIFCALYS